MLEDMAVRQFGEKTRHDYIRHIESFARFLGRSPDTATAEDVRRFQVHLTESGVQPPTLNGSASALRFLFGTTLDRAELARHLARVSYPRKLPRVLSPEEVGRLLEAAPGPGLKYKAALSIAYGAGLRAGEVVMLRVGDIDSKRMLVRVEQGKGRKDRHAMLSPQLLELLRAWWRQCRSPGWLFPGRDPVLPITARQLNRVCHMAAEAAGLGTRVRSLARNGRKRRAAKMSAFEACVQLITATRNLIKVVERGSHETQVSSRRVHSSPERRAMGALEEGRRPEVHRPRVRQAVIVHLRPHQAQRRDKTAAKTALAASADPFRARRNLQRSGRRPLAPHDRCNVGALALDDQPRDQP
jgi:site-specific recombinase XerD